MTTYELTLLASASVVFFIGFVANFLPVIPATLVIWLGMLGHHLLTAQGTTVGWGFLTVMLGVVLIAQILDFACTWWGAKKFGATWKGALGAVLGAIIGTIFFSLPGMILGPIIGAVLFELLNFRTREEAFKAGLGTIVGGLMALAIKLGLSVMMIAAFYWVVLL